MKLSGWQCGSLLVLLFCSLVHSQAPENDLCANAIVVESLDTTFTHPGSTINSAKEHHCNSRNVAGDVWYSYLPTQDIVVEVSLCDNSDFDTFLYIVTGSCNPDLSYCEARNNDYCGTASKIMGYKMFAGTQYYVVVSGAADYVGNYVLTISRSDLSSCGGGPQVVTLPGSFTGELTEASPPANIACYPLTTERSAWYSFIPTADMLLLITTTCTSEFLGPAVVVILRGDCESNDCFYQREGDCTLGFNIATHVQRNLQYFIVVSSTDAAATGSFTVTVEDFGVTNDDVCGPYLIESIPFLHVQSIIPATQDFACVNGAATIQSSGPDVWYRFTPTVNYPRVKIFTCNSDGPFAIYLAKGTNCQLDLQCIQYDSSSCTSGAGGGLIRTSFVAGQRYYIAVATVAGSPSTFRLEINIPSVGITCPADFSRVAVRNTCQYPGTTGTPLISSSSGTTIAVSKDKLPPYSIGTTVVTYTATNQATNEVVSCAQSVTITQPTGNCRSA